MYGNGTQQLEISSELNATLPADLFNRFDDYSDEETSGSAGNFDITTKLSAAPEQGDLDIQEPEIYSELENITLPVEFIDISKSVGDTDPFDIAAPG